MDRDFIDLSDLLDIIAEGVETAVPESVWVRAEISSISVNRSGHCYMELSQSENGKTVSQARCIIWANVFRQISPYFEGQTGSPLAAGQKVLLRVSVEMSRLYGMSLIADDVDPSYTLGDAKRRQRETLERLEKEGLVKAQRELCLSELPRRFAVISAEGAAGYRDFMRHLHENESGCRFYTRLFPAPMQGADCAAGIAAALEDVVASGIHFDAVLILRGGGGSLDLSCYDEYQMCSAIALCPFPVLTAIGHDQDVHICDMVAWDSVKTPTALADYFLDAVSLVTSRLDRLSERLKNAGRTRISLLLSRLDVLKARLEAADPENLLKKGYILVTGDNGGLVKRASQTHSGEKLVLRFPDGKVEVIVV